MCVLDLSELNMFDFYCDHLKACYDNNIRMLYTDSLTVHTEIDNVHADTLLDSDLYDTSNNPTDHPLYSTANKKVIGKFKDELAGRNKTKFIGLRSKMYSYWRPITRLPYTQCKQPMRTPTQLLVWGTLMYNIFNNFFLQKSLQIFTACSMATKKDCFLLQWHKKNSPSLPGLQI